MKQTSYTFPAGCHPDLVGKEFLAYETVTPGLVVVDFGEEAGWAAALTHAASGWAVLHADAGKRPADLCKIAGALGGLDIDFTRDAQAVMASPAELDDLQLRIFLLLVMGRQRLHSATLQGYRKHLREMAAKFDDVRKAQLAAMR